MIKRQNQAADKKGKNMNKKAYYGEYGGQFVSESLMNTLDEIDKAFEEAIKDPEFIKQYHYYLKQYVGLPAGPVQIFSTVGIAGGILGYFCYGFLLKKLKLKGMELITHFIFILTAFAMFLLQKDMPYFLWLTGTAYFLTSFGASTYLCNSSTEMLALAPPGNKPMTMAFQQTYQYIGMAVGRTGTSLILGLNLLAPVWNIGSISFSFYQTLFLLYGIIAAVSLLVLPTLPSITTKRHDYYDQR